MKIVWQKELENYLIHRQSLQGLVLLMDIRHPLQHFDVMMLEWAYSRKLFVHVLLTKSDKMNRGPANQALLDVKQQLKKMKLDFSIQLFSSLNKQGLEELASVMGGRLNFTLEQSAEFDIALIPEAEADDLAEDSIEDDLAEDSIEDDESEAFDAEEIEVDTPEQAPKPD